MSELSHLFRSESIVWWLCDLIVCSSLVRRWFFMFFCNECECGFFSLMSFSGRHNFPRETVMAISCSTECFTTCFYNSLHHLFAQLQYLLATGKTFASSWALHLLPYELNNTLELFTMWWRLNSLSKAQ